jgi:hypothetical protein
MSSVERPAAYAISILVPSLFRTDSELAEVLANLSRSSQATNRVALSNLKSGKLRFNQRWQNLLLKAVAETNTSLTPAERTEIEDKLKRLSSQIGETLHGEQFHSDSSELQLTDSLLKQMNNCWLFLRTADYESKIFEVGNIFALVFLISKSTASDWPTIRLFLEPADFEFFFERLNAYKMGVNPIIEEDILKIGNVVVIKCQLVEMMTRSILALEANGVRSYFDLFEAGGPSRNSLVAWKRLASLPRAISREMNRAPHCLSEGGVSPQSLTPPIAC